MNVNIIIINHNNISYFFLSLLFLYFKCGRPSHGHFLSQHSNQHFDLLPFFNKFWSVLVPKFSITFLNGFFYSLNYGLVLIFAVVGNHLLSRHTLPSSVWESSKFIYFSSNGNVWSGLVSYVWNSHKNSIKSSPLPQENKINKSKNFQRTPTNEP